MLTSSLQELDFDEDRAPRCMKSILLLNSVLTKSRSSDLAGVHQQGIARNETSFAISLCILIIQHVDKSTRVGIDPTLISAGEPDESNLTS